MGINKGSSFLYSLSALTLGNLCSIVTTKAERAGRKGEPRIIIDFSWLLFKMKSKSSLQDTTQSLNGFLSVLLSEGFFVTIVMDPPNSRHYTKKATIQRNAERDFLIVEAINLKTELLNASKKLQKHQYNSAEEKDNIIDRIKMLEKKIRSCENKSLSRLTEEYIEYCTTQVLKFVSKWNDQVTTMTGLYQADTTIADLLSNRKVDVAVGNDCDFSYLCGRHSLQITDFKLGKLKTSRGRKSHSTTNETFLKTDHALSNICLSCSNIEDIDLCSEITRIKYDIPKATPILNDMKDIRCRCLVAVLLGNDTFPPSLKKHTILT